MPELNEDGSVRPAAKYIRRGLGVKTVKCPWCGAAPGQPCVVPGTSDALRLTAAHDSRTAAYKAKK